MQKLSFGIRGAPRGVMQSLTEAFAARLGKQFTFLKFCTGLKHKYHPKHDLHLMQRYQTTLEFPSQ